MSIIYYYRYPNSYQLVEVCVQFLPTIGHYRMPKVVYTDVCTRCVVSFDLFILQLVYFCLLLFISYLTWCIDQYGHQYTYTNKRLMRTNNNTSLTICHLLSRKRKGVESAILITSLRSKKSFFKEIKCTKEKENTIECLSFCKQLKNKGLRRFLFFELPYILTLDIYRTNNSYEHM